MISVVTGISSMDAKPDSISINTIYFIIETVFFSKIGETA